ncbi:MAG: type II toxin-antitoxin system RelE/ParE family toxin [Candidatus Rokubacteria bacterium]|nr:type II toxin-antitoxin system RelE/ParE family toxin [Candidatus Rokubacteria bacterium]MBI4627833.1 type II toxin-antitoxin system RelE/ParE family toxin [Candidatus Rokubacteria bacterium]
MAKHAVELSSRAFADLGSVSRDIAARISKGLRELEENPFPRGDTPTYRLRIGDYRAIYRIHGAVVAVLRIIHRSELDRALRDLV